jgi:hypothetical protein
MQNIRHLRDLLEGDHEGRDLAQLTGQLRDAERAVGSIILATARHKGSSSLEDVGTAHIGTLADFIRNIAKRAGILSVINPHVLRRTFAFMVVHQCHGDLRCLRKHFQHWSIDTTTAYASHAERDAELSDAIGAEMLELKTDLVSRWLQEDEVLAGGAGRHIEAMREAPEFRAHTLKDRRELAVVLQDGLNIRPTGHGWCVASGMAPCGGRGLYDPRECAENCDGAVITRKELPLWVSMTRQMLEARSLGDCGPAGALSVERNLLAFDMVLNSFGLTVKQVSEEMCGVDNAA